MINPDEIIKQSFKILSRRRRSLSRKKNRKVPEEQEETQKVSDVETPLPPPVLIIIPESPPCIPVEKPKEPSASILFSQESVSKEERDSQPEEDDNSYLSGTSVSVYDDSEKGEEDGKEYALQVEDGERVVQIIINGKDLTQVEVIPDDNANQAAEVTSIGSGNARDTKKKRRRRLFKRRITSVDDRRRNSWLPCTCPQYKVSNELASKWNLQAMFFGKIMLIKIAELLVINLSIFTAGYFREDTLDFFTDNHNWTYLSYGLFIALLVCIRSLLTYRARWPVAITLISTIPLTFIIAFIAACITVIYNSILIPTITCTLLLAFTFLTFTPYFLGKSVMHRIINFAGVGLTLVSSICFLFLKEVEEKNLSYWDYIPYVWLPGAIISQIIVFVSIVEIQRMLFGLCFNISTKRWHVAALYL